MCHKGAAVTVDCLDLQVDNGVAAWRLVWFCNLVQRHGVAEHRVWRRISMGGVIQQRCMRRYLVERQGHCQIGDTRSSVE